MQHNSCQSALSPAAGHWIKAQIDHLLLHLPHCVNGAQAKRATTVTSKVYLKLCGNRLIAFGHVILNSPILT